MTTIVTGKTFDHRETLKALNGRWNPIRQCWQFDYASRATIERLRKLVGCSVVEEDNRTDDNDLDAAVNFILDARQRDQPPKHGERESVLFGDDHRYHNYFKDKNPTVFFGFSSLSAMVRYIKRIPHEHTTGERDAGYEIGSDATEWTGTRNMNEALSLTENGWKEGTDNAAEILELLNIEHATKRRRQLAITGGHVSVGRLLSGNPVHMVKRPKLPGKRVVTLFVAGGNSAFVGSDQMITRAAIIAAIADILEREGYSCEIVNIWAAKDMIGKPAVQIATTLKHAGEKLNLNDLTFAFGHPSMLRRLAFACVCSSDELHSIWLSQGMPGEAFNSHYMPARNEFYIPHLTRNYKGELREQALAMLPDIKPLNLPIEIGKKKC